VSSTEEQNLIRRRPRGATVLACWLFFSAFPPLYDVLQRGGDIVLTPLATIELAYAMVAVICTIGLLRIREWARKGLVWFFAVYFLWALFAVNILVGPYFDALVRYHAQSFFLSVDHVRKILLVLVFVYIVWPLVAIIYLTYPGVKLRFRER